MTPAVDLPPLLVIHGGRDGVVAPGNGDSAAQLWSEAAGASAVAARTVQRGKRHPMTVTDYRLRGRTVVTLIGIAGLAHAWGGVHESLDGGRSFAPLIEGLDVVEGFDASQPTFHDPHCVRLCPTNPDRLYQQNHCGIYRLDRQDTRWRKIGDTMPPEVGEIGFPMVVHARDADTAWVFPMDGTSVWPRTSPDGRPAVYVTRDAGASWQRLDAGLPKAQAWWTVKRQAMTADSQDTIGLYFGTTSGELWASRDEGAHWSCIAQRLPDIYAVEVAERPAP